MKTFILFTISFFTITSCINKKSSNNENDIQKIVHTKMQEQEACWNRGDIDCFMKHYWQSDSLEFIGKSGLTRGWQKTLDNYKKSYSNKDEMGQLSFEYLKEELIDNNTFHIIGKWKLLRNVIGDTLQGHFTLLWQKRNNEWVIISDHSS